MTSRRQPYSRWDSGRRRRSSFFAPAEAPHYTEEDVTREYHAGPEFPSMVGEAQRRLGRILSTEELKILLCIYRYLGLAPEVISILISYCIQRGHARGVSRMPSIRTIEKEAYRWADLGHRDDGAGRSLYAAAVTAAKRHWPGAAAARHRRAGG